MSDPSPQLNEFEERCQAAGRLLPGFVGAGIVLASRAAPEGPEGQRWDSYLVRGGLAPNLALATQLVVDLPVYLIDGPKHVAIREGACTLQGTTLPENAIEILGVHLGKSSEACWLQLQEVFSRVALLGAVFDSSRTYTFVRLWFPTDVPAPRAMGSFALFADHALANLLAQARKHFQTSIARQVYERLPGALDSIS
jgi:hypothetical protein